MRFRIDELRSLIREAMLNAYEILGISQNATEDEIKTAYRRKAIEFHPDRNNDRDTTADMVKVNAAKEILSDPAKRKALDFQLQYGGSSGGGKAGGPESWDDFWRRTSGAASGASSSERQSGSSSGWSWSSASDAAHKKRQEKKRKERAAKERAEQRGWRGSKQTRSHTDGEANYRDNYGPGDVILDQRLTFVDGSYGKRGSSKSWRVIVTKITNLQYNIEIRFGRIGSKERTVVYSFVSATAAVMFARKKIDQKLASGYKEDPSKDPGSTSQRTRNSSHSGASSTGKSTSDKTKSSDSSDDFDMKLRTIYGRHGRFHVHTRIKGQVYGKGSETKARKGDKLHVNSDGDRISVMHPKDGWTQSWEKE